MDDPKDTLVPLREPFDERSAEFDNAVATHNTRRGYTSDLKHFGYWCQQNSISSKLPIPPAIVARYLTACASSFKVSTLERRLAAISMFHRQAGFESPTHDLVVQTRLKGIKRVMGTHQDPQLPLRIDLLEKILGVIPDTTLAGLRDRSLLLTGYVGGFRRTEFVLMDVAQLEVKQDRIVIHLYRTKTDQEAKGSQVVLLKHPTRIDLCPVNALIRWLHYAKIGSGDVYRAFDSKGQITGHAPNEAIVTRIIKERMVELGLNPKGYSAHSLRAGFVTDAMANGALPHEVMRQTRHRKVETVLKYQRESDPLAGNAVNVLWKGKKDETKK